MGRMRIPKIVLMIAAAVPLLASPASARTTSAVVDDAVNTLRTDSIYVSPEAERLPEAELTALEDAVEEAEPDTGEIYIAVLPDDAGDPSQLLQALGEGLGENGTYAVVAGRSLQVATTRDGRISGEAVAAVGDDAVAGNRGGTVSAVLLDFVTGIEDVATGEAPADGGAGQATGDDGSGFGGLLIPGLLLAGGGYALYRARKRRREERQQLEEVKREVLVDLAALDAETRELHLRMDLPDVPQEAKAEYVEALEAYSQASVAIDQARRPSDLQPVSERIERGVFAAATARARLDGEPLPEHRLPCFFDPRHGPSLRDVTWAPPGGGRSGGSRMRGRRHPGRGGTGARDPAGRGRRPAAPDLRRARLLRRLGRRLLRDGRRAVPGPAARLVSVRRVRRGLGPRRLRRLGW